VAEVRFTEIMTNVQDNFHRSSYLGSVIHLRSIASPFFV